MKYFATCLSCTHTFNIYIVFFFFLYSSRSYVARYEVVYIIAIEIVAARSFRKSSYVLIRSLFEKCCRDNRNNDSMINKWQWRVRKRVVSSWVKMSKRNFDCGELNVQNRFLLQASENTLEMLSKKFENFLTIIGFRCYVICNF